MENNKKKLLILLIALIVIIFVVFIIFQPKTESIETNLNVQYISNKSGPPTVESSEYKKENWDRVPELDSLNALASDQNGGSLGRIAYIHASSTEIYPIYYLKAEIFGDYENIFMYFKYDNGWSTIDKRDIPKTELIAIDDKLKSDGSK